jgi:hypothetical protein
MDLVKTKYKKKVNHITQYINTNIHKTTTNTTKYMKQVWNKARIKRTVNICFFKITCINTIGVDSAKFGNEAHFIYFVSIVASRNGTDGSNFDI